MKDFKKIYLLIVTILVGFMAIAQSPEVNYTYSAVCESVYDGDTVTLNVDLGFRIHLENVKIRVYGLDTPEKSRASALEKEAGKLVQEYVDELLMSSDIVIQTVKSSDKYGRYLAKIYTDGTFLTELLLDKQYAKEYYGGKKEKWTNEELQYIINDLDPE